MNALPKINIAQQTADALARQSNKMELESRLRQMGFTGPELQAAVKDATLRELEARQQSDFAAADRVRLRAEEEQQRAEEEKRRHPQLAPAVASPGQRRPQGPVIVGRNEQANKLWGGNGIGGRTLMPNMTTTAMKGGMAPDDGYRIGGEGDHRSQVQPKINAMGALDRPEEEETLSPQEAFERRRAMGKPLSEQEIADAHAFANRWQRTFDPEKGYSAGIPGFADGGTPPKNEWFTVGERGPEAMKIDENGDAAVVPNEMLPLMVQEALGGERIVRGKYGTGTAVPLGPNGERQLNPGGLKQDDSGIPKLVQEQIRVIEGLPTKQIETKYPSIMDSQFYVQPAQRQPAPQPRENAGPPESVQRWLKPEGVKDRNWRNFINSPGGLETIMRFGREDQRFDRIEASQERNYQRARADDRADRAEDRKWSLEVEQRRMDAERERWKAERGEEPTMQVTEIPGSDGRRMVTYGRAVVGMFGGPEQQSGDIPFDVLEKWGMKPTKVTSRGVQWEKPETPQRKVLKVHDEPDGSLTNIYQDGTWETIRKGPNNSSPAANGLKDRVKGAVGN